MATIPELEAALRKAHAAGQTDHARRFASEIQRMRQANAKPLPGSNPTQGMGFGQRFGAGVGKSLVDTKQGTEQAVADVLATATRPGQVMRQGGGLVNEAAGQATDTAMLTATLGPFAMPAQLLEQEMRAAGIDDPFGLLQQYAAERATERRKVDAPLMKTPAGVGGNIVGTLTQILAPGLAAPKVLAGAPQVASAVRAASLPKTITGAAAQGVGLGLLQPVAEGESRLVNAAIGGGGGAGGALVGRGIGAAVRAAAKPFRPAVSSTDARVAEVLRQEAENVGRLSTPAPSAVPGVQRTLAEESLDPGIARLERLSRSQGKGFDDLDRANNAARIRALEGFAKDKAAVSAAEAARATAANSLRKEAMTIDGVDTSRLISQIGRLQKAQQGRPAVQFGLGQVKSLLQREVSYAERAKASIKPLEDFIASDHTSATNREAAKQAIAQIRAGERPTVDFIATKPGTAGLAASHRNARAALVNARKAWDITHKGHDRVAVLDNVRKTIGDMLSGKYGGESASALAGSRELMAVKNQLDRVLGKQAPQYGQYLDAWRTGSKPINRMETGQELIRRGSANPMHDDLNTGAPTLSPAQFSRAASDLDGVAAAATGFRKAKAADILQPEDMRTIAAVKDDLGRRAFASTAGSGGGSPTFERLAGNDRLVNSVVARIPYAGPAMQWLRDIGQQQLQARLAEVLANPLQARAILAAMPPRDRMVLQMALQRMGGTGTAVVTEQ